MYIGNREFAVKEHTYVMGILNVTPDSFSDGGKYEKTEAALRHAEDMIRQGVDIVDVGGQSTRPGYVQISDDEEIDRIFPVITALKKEFDVPLSLDTYKSRVAAAGIEAGADMINDICGLKYDPDMAGVIAQAGISCCLMHNTDVSEEENVTETVMNGLKDSLDLALAAGIDRDKIILDPGIGFGKSYEDNLKILNSIGKFNHAGYPVLLGASRKSVIGLTLGLPAEERLEGTIATSVWAVMNHISFIRVHDVEENIRAVKMAEAIRNMS